MPDSKQIEARRALAEAVVSDWHAFLNQKQGLRSRPRQFDGEVGRAALVGLIVEAFGIIDAPEATGSDPSLRSSSQEGGDQGAPPIIEFHQRDWIPGFAAFLPGSTTPEGRAFCVINLGSMLSTVAHGDVPAADLPAFVVESMVHEVGHVLEQWAGVEFSEERVEALCDRYRAAVNSKPHIPTEEAGDGR